MPFKNCRTPIVTIKHYIPSFPRQIIVLQYKLKSSIRWRDYPGKDKIKGDPNQYDFRLLNKDKTKILVEKGSYEKVLKRFRQIEFFKHKR